MFFNLFGSNSGELSAQERISKFREGVDGITEYKKKLEAISNEINAVVKALGDTEEYASNILSGEVDTVKDIRIIVDNIKYSGSRVASSVTDIQKSMRELSYHTKSQSMSLSDIMDDKMVDTVANIIHDKKIEKALSVIVDAYVNKQVGRAELVTAFNKAKSQLSTGLDISKVITDRLSD